MHYDLGARLQRAQSLDDGASGIVGRGEQLVDGKCAGLGVVEDDIGKGAADVGAREGAGHRP